MNAPIDRKPSAKHEDTFYDIHFRASENWSCVQALRECFDVSRSGLQPALVPYLDNSIRTTMGTSFPGIAEETNREILRRMAAQKETLARSAIDAATIVFVQATLDSAVNDYLVLLTEAEPRIWENDLADKTIQLGEFKQRAYSDVLRDKAIAHSKSLAKKSLANKIQLILDHCYRKDVALRPAGFHFSSERVKEFDDLRHDIAHGRGLGKIVDNMDQLLLFLWQTLLSIESVVATYLGIHQDPTREFKRAFYGEGLVVKKVTL